MDTELKKITPNGNKGAAYLCDENVTASNGEGQGAPEREGLLFTQPISHNGGAEPFDCEAAVEKPKNTHPSQEESAMFRIKRELNEFVFWKIRLWMIIVFIFLLIVAVLLISLAVCSAIHKDEDENFDLSLFKVPLYFNGSFELPGKVFTDEPSTPYSNESQALVDGLKEKLTDLYKTSPALGRYFSKADVYIFRKGSDIADYQLTFLLPEEELDQLRNFTLSREMASGKNICAGIMGTHCSSLDDILEEDMHHWYTKFMRESPSGLITLFELKTILEMNGMTEEASSYVDQVFYTFDMDGDGYIDFVEYIAAISLLLKGEINQKLKWYFKLFDQDGNGKIDKDELETIFKAIQDITRTYDIPPEEIVTLIYDKIDVNGEGELTLEEFISGAREHPDIMEMLTKMMDLSHVLEIIIRGQKKKTD